MYYTFLPSYSLETYGWYVLLLIGHLPGTSDGWGEMGMQTRCDPPSLLFGKQGLSLQKKKKNVSIQVKLTYTRLPCLRLDPFGTWPLPNPSHFRHKGFEKGSSHQYTTPCLVVLAADLFGSPCLRSQLWPIWLKWVLRRCRVGKVVFKYDLNQMIFKVIGA